MAPSGPDGAWPRRRVLICTEPETATLGCEPSPRIEPRHSKKARHWNRKKTPLLVFVCVCVRLCLCVCVWNRETLLFRAEGAAAVASKGQRECGVKRKEWRINKRQRTRPCNATDSRPAESRNDRRAPAPRHSDARRLLPQPRHLPFSLSSTLD